MYFKLKNKNDITLYTRNRRCREDILIGIDDAEKEKIIPENIAEGQNILGVIGTFRGGVDTSDATATANDILAGKTAYVNEEKLEGTIETYDYSNSAEVSPEIDKFITKAFTEYTNDRVTSISLRTFQNWSKLEKVDFPNVTYVGEFAFYSCTSLVSANFPNATHLHTSAFRDCRAIEYLNFPKVKTMNNEAFRDCRKLKTIDFGPITALSIACLASCYSLTKVIIRYTDKVTTLANVTAFQNSYHFHGTVDATYNPEGLKDGYIYVPDSLVENYKVATNWSSFADQIKPLSELEVE